MQQETITALEVFEAGLTKSGIKAMAESTVASVVEQGNPLQVAEALTAMENYIKEVKDSKQFKDYVREEAVKYGKSYVSPSGAKIEIAETGTKYDFTNCNDPKYLDYLRDVEDANNQLKAHADFLKTIPGEGVEVVRGDEVVRIYPPSKTSTSSYKVTLAR